MRHRWGLAVGLAIGLAGTAPAQVPGGIAWVDGWEAAVKAAKAKPGAMVLVYVRRLAPPAPGCAELEKGVLADPALAAALAGHVACRVTTGTKDASPGIAAFLRRYLVLAPPALVLLTADGASLQRWPATFDVAGIVAVLRGAAAKEAEYQAACKAQDAEFAASGAAEPLEQLAEALHDRCQWTEAAAAWRRVLAKQASGARLACLADALGCAGDTKGALAAWEKAIATEKEPEEVAGYRLQRAQLRVDTGDIDGAIAELKRAEAAAKAAEDDDTVESLHEGTAHLYYERVCRLQLEGDAEAADRLQKRFLADTAYADTKAAARARGDDKAPGKGAHD